MSELSKVKLYYEELPKNPPKAFKGSAPKSKLLKNSIASVKKFIEENFE